MILEPVRGLPEITPGTDLAALLIPALGSLTWPDRSRGLADGDVVVVTSKVVAKAEGRFVALDRREAAIDAESVGLVARIPGPDPAARITRTRHGLVLAASGVDASNVPEDHVLMLPVDPDASARALLGRFREVLASRIGVVISDTAGRAWRLGQVDIAIGAAGLAPLVDLRGSLDHNGRMMTATVRAVGDAVAAAAELVAGKSERIPVVVIRGLDEHVQDLDGPGAAALIRPLSEDLFALGTAEALAQGYARGLADGANARDGAAPVARVAARDRDAQGPDAEGQDAQDRNPQGPDAEGQDAQDRNPQGPDAEGRDTQDLGLLGLPALGALIAGRRTIRTFTDRSVPADVIRDAVSLAVTAPAPHHSRPWLYVHLADPDRRAALLARMSQQWEDDLRGDGFSDAAIGKRLSRGDVLRQAPEVVAVFMRTQAAHTYPDERRRRAEREMFVAAGGASLAQFLLALSTAGLGAAWVSSSIFCPEVSVAALGLSDDHLALGMVAIGWPAGPAPAARPAHDPPLLVV